ncbi:MAG: GIY-YIG nuclease family protein [Candidatus Omnitrophota bacterium]
MHYVYVLQSENSEYIYVGSTNDLERRVKEHNKGQNYATKKYIPLKLVYYEAYLDKKDASNREHKLKHHGSAIGHLKKRLFNSLVK